ncbi:MAG: hypothetical protein GF320_04325 [Armatimonadia bacterium]|nr:hypothetical protein [Armatimonadia bacterium]
MWDLLGKFLEDNVCWLVLGVVLLVLGLLLAPLRRSGLRTLARELGLSFSAQDTLDLARRLDFRVFRQGRWRRVRNVLSGRYRGHTVCCFDFEMGYGRRLTDEAHSWTMVLVRTPCPYPELHIRPEGVWDRAKEAVGLNDLDFESEDFSRRYHVTASDPKLAYAVLHPRAIELLLSTDSLVIEGDESALLFRTQREGLLGAQDELVALLDIAVDFVALTPRYLTKEASST